VQQFPQKVQLDKQLKTEMADFIEEIGHLNFGSPSWTNFELSREFQKKPEPILVNEKATSCSDMALNEWIPSADELQQSLAIYRIFLLS